MNDYEAREKVPGAFSEAVKADTSVGTLNKIAVAVDRRYYVARHLGMQLDRKTYFRQPMEQLLGQFFQRCRGLWAMFEHPGEKEVEPEDMEHIALDIWQDLRQASSQFKDMRGLVQGGDKDWLRMRLKEIAESVETL